MPADLPVFWLALPVAAIWCLFQLLVLFVASQCAFALVDLGANKSRFAFLDQLLLSVVGLVFWGLLLLPVISAAVFIYTLFGISQWLQLMPGVWVFVGWLLLLILFLSAISAKEFLHRHWPA